MSEEFLEKLRATFKLEAEEHMQAIEAGLLELEATEPDRRRKAIDSVFRAAHSLKGAARAVDFREIESVCQLLEEVFASLRRQGCPVPSAAVLDTLHQSLNWMSAVFADLGKDDGARAHELAAVHTTLQEAMQGIVDFGASPPPIASDRVQAFQSRSNVPVSVSPAAPADNPVRSVATVRLPVATLESRLLEAEEMLAAKIAAHQRVVDLRELSGAFDPWHTVWSTIEPDARKLRQETSHDKETAAALTRLIGFFDWTHDSLKAIESKAALLARAAARDEYAVARLVDDLIERSKQLLMLPFGSISASFPKLIRDLARSLRKEVELTIEGEQVQLDRRILEEIKDGLVHILRNAVDHGIEPPDVRERAGKPRRATIAMTVKQLSIAEVEILISDDGQGLDAAKLRQSAIERGVLTDEEASRLSRSEILNLALLSDVSTSPMVTELSGRGLGLAIVREKAEKLGGHIFVQSTRGAGASFRIVIPATHSAFRGILIEVAGSEFVVPTRQVEHVARFDPEDVRTVEARETICFADRPVPLVYMSDVLELTALERNPASPSTLSALILGSGEQRVAFCVDAVLDELELLIKPLRKPLVRVRNIAGAAIVASGRIAPVLNVSDLLKSARTSVSAHVPSAPRGRPAETKRILVVEDSITSRMLLKTILESAGYDVRTAIDGMEAFASLRTEPFDLVVSDVEMPRLNGFDLTARIRADRGLAALPVVLVTARHTREDRERGIDVGANAYLVKSRFDQGNLLETVRRLI